MFLKGPTPGGGVSYGGVYFKTDQEGVLAIDDANTDMIRVLKESHGFIEHKPEPVAQPAPPAPKQKAAAAKSEPPPPPPPAEDAPKALLTDEEIESMARDDMFAFLKARGVSVPGNMSNVNLREAVRENRAAPETAPPTE